MHPLRCLFFVTEHFHIIVEAVREGEYSSGCTITKQPFLFSTGNSRGRQSSSTNSKSTADAIGGGTTELDITSLDRVVCHLYQAGLAQSTHKVYASGKKWYLECCRKLGSSPLPATEGRRCYFVAFLKEQGRRHQTVKSYLSAVRHLQISQGLGDPNMSSMPRLEYVVRGLKKEQAGQPKRTELPITPGILRKIRQK